MTFDKKQYWENREAGIRGQGENKTPTEVSMTNNRASRRRKFINHSAQSKTARISTPEQDAIVRGRILRKEQGEQERIAKKKAELAEVK